MRRRQILLCLPGALAGCAPTPEQQAAALMPEATASELRARQSRRFDTADRQLMLQAVLGALQDLGYAIDETQARFGIVVGSKIGNGLIRAQVLVQPAPGNASTVVRATFQIVRPRPGAMLPTGEELADPTLYRAFFEKLSQSLFLTAHEI